MTRGTPRLSLDSYKSLKHSKQDKSQLLTLHKALSIPGKTMGKDDCGLWVIKGEDGYISTWGDGSSFLIYMPLNSYQHGNHVRKALRFCTVTQEGEDSCVLRLSHLPDPGQAEAIRSVVGLGK